MIIIVMSTYNGKAYLSEQLDSILAQTLQEWQLLVRDDGSTDSTPLILRKYAERFPDKIIVSSSSGKNMGVPRSYESLLWEVVGMKAEYVQLSDQDDVWFPDKLRITYESLLREQRALPAGTPVLLHTDLKVVDEHLNEISPSFWRYVNINPPILDNDIHYLAICNSVTGCATMFNQYALRAVLPFPADIFMHDAWIGLKVKYVGGKVAYIDQPTLLYRQHGDNVCGATPYRFTVSNWKEKLEMARHSYKTGHPLVFKNRLHFLYWKMRYFFKLHCS